MRALSVKTVVYKREGFSRSFQLKAALQGRGIDRYRFDGGTRLSARGGTVKQHSADRFAAADHRLDGAGLVVYNGHRGLRLDDFLTQRIFLGRKFFAVFFEEVRIISKELRGNDEVIILVSTLIWLRNIDVAARDGVELSVVDGVHALHFDAVIGLSGDCGIVDR